MAQRSRLRRSFLGSVALILGLATTEIDGEIVASEMQQATGADRSTSGSLYSRNLGIAFVTTGTEDCAYRLRIYMTRDTGRSWREITPGKFPCETFVHDHVFLNAHRGRLVSNDCSGGEAFLYRTDDGGRNWSRTPVNPASCNAGATLLLDFVDRRHGWLGHLEPTSGGDGDLQWTGDAGRSWSKVHDLPSTWLTELSFRNRRRGYLGGTARMHPNRLYSSTDRGRDWNRERVKRPPGYGDATLYYDAPTFTGGAGVLRVSLVKNRREDIAFHVTRDGGRTWRRRTLLRTQARVERRGFVSSLGSSVASDEVWWVIARDAPYIYITTNGGQDWTRRRADELPGPGSLTAIGPKTAWATVYDESSERNLLYRTRDGGRTWTRLHPGS